jgi:hypothetical protein
MGLVSVRIVGVFLICGEERALAMQLHFNIFDVAENSVAPHRTCQYQRGGFLWDVRNNSQGSAHGAD